MKNTGIVVGIVIVVVAAIIGVAALGGFSSHPTTTTVPGATTSISSSASMTNVPVMMTDPAQVPAGTSALVFTYTSMQVYETGPSGSSSWVNAAGNGSVNLIAIQNRTQVMGYANVTANSTISQVRLNVTSVKITVNGTTYNVSVSYPTVTVPVSGSAQVSAGSGVLIDYTPTVSAAFSGNSTTFVRVPATKAVIVGNVNSSFATNIGATASLSANASASLAAITPNIQITSSSLAASGSDTTASVTVKNNGNQSVVINTVNVYGQQKVAATASASAGVSAAMASSVNGVLVGGTAGIGAFNLLSASAKIFATVGIDLQSYSMQTFSAGSSGSLILVSGSSSVQSGVTIAPGASATLTYSGTATYNNDTFTTTPKSGSHYTINVVGSSGAYATTSATAS